jgi:hypothetical protein
MTLKIGKPYIVQNDKTSRLCSVISENGAKYEMWFEVEQKYEEYLCHERADAFLLVILPYAMEKQLNIESEADISEQLFYQISTFFTVSMAKYVPGYNNIKITANLNSKHLPCANAVGTGLSCGVDSFYSIYTNLKGAAKGFNLTHLTFFNVGSHGDKGGDTARALFKERIKASKTCADELGFDLLWVDSNISEFLNISFVATHTYRSFSAVLALQKFFKTYYYSSGYPVNEFSLTKGELSSAYYDLLSAPCFSNENTTFYITGIERERIEKIEEITEYPPTYKHLNVCVIGSTNCSCCEKCVRTLLSLYAIGKLDLYKDVFNLESFYQNISRHLAWLISKKGITYYDEIINRLRTEKINIPIKSRTKAFFIRTKCAVMSFLRRVHIVRKVYNCFSGFVNQKNIKQ